MKGFIEIPRENGLCLININHIVLIRQRISSKGENTDIYLSTYDRSTIQNDAITIDGLPAGITNIYPIIIHCDMSYSDVLHLLAQA